MNKTLIALAITFTVALVARADNTPIESCVDLAHYVPMPGAQAVAVATITLPPGHWAVSAVGNIYFGAQAGTVFGGGVISTEVAVSLDGHTAFPSLQLNHSDNTTIAITPGRVFRNITQNTDVHLVMWVNQPGQPPPNGIAWGCISAVRP